MAKRMLSFFLAAIMVFSFMPVTAFAAGGDGKVLPYSFDFETNPFSEANGWTHIDADGDGYTWESITNKVWNIDKRKWGVDNSYCAVSASYDNVKHEALNTDNWLFSPALVIPENGAIISWYERSQDDNFPDSYTVYVGENAVAEEYNESTCPAGMNVLWDYHVADISWKQISVELAAEKYGGKTVYIAFRHENYDCFMLEIDNFVASPILAVTNGTPESDNAKNHGYITIDKTIATSDENLTVIVNSAEGYQLKSLTVNQTDEVGPNSTPFNPIRDEQNAMKYTFAMPAYDVTVSAVFEEKPTYNVKFDLNNGETNGPENQFVESGKKASAPEAPTYEGFKFAGWYTDKDCTDGNEYDFDSEVTKDLILYAKWKPALSPDPEPDPKPEPDPVEVYYAPLIADLMANEEGVIEWKAGDALPLEAVCLLVEKPKLSLEFTFTYKGEEHEIYIPAGAFEKYYDVTIPWYGAAWLIQYFEKPQKDVIEYIIVKDDTLNAIAEKFKCTVEEILALNSFITNPNKIYPNNKLIIPVQK